MSRTSSSGIGQSLSSERTSQEPLMRESTKPSWGSKCCCARAIAVRRRTGTFSSGILRATFAFWRASATARRPFFAVWFRPSRVSTFS